MFSTSSMLVVLIIPTVLMTLLQVLTIMTVCGACVAGARVFIPDENLVFCPEKTLTQVRSLLERCWKLLMKILQVIAHIHYFPVQWRGQAHTYSVMAELDMLFRYTAMYLIGRKYKLP